MKKRVLSMFMALALCLTLLPAPAWAAEADAILEQAAENGIAAQNDGDSTVGNAVAEVTSGGTTTQYADIGVALSAANAGDTLTLLKDVTGDYTVIIDKAIIFDLNGHTIRSLQVHVNATIKDSGATKGSIGTLEIPNLEGITLTLGDLLEQGYAFRCNSDNNWVDGAYKSAKNVSVQRVPITSVTLTALNANGTDASTSIPYGTTNGIKLSASCTRQGAGKLSCQWYTIGGTLQLINGATEPVYQLPADLSVGKHTYRVTFTESCAC